MKKYVKCLALIIFSMFMFASCKMGEQSSKENKQEFNTAIATNIVEMYMNMIQKGEFEGLKKYYSKELLEKQKEVGASADLIMTGWVLEEISEVGNSSLYKIKVSKISKDTPISTLDKLSIKVIKEEGEYKIKEISSAAQKEIFNEGSNLRIRNKNDVKTSLLMELTGLPGYAYQKDDAGKITKIPIPRQQISTSLISYSGSKVAITSCDKGSYLGLIKVDEVLVNQGKDQNNQQSGGDSTPSTAREIPVGKEISSMDYIKDARIYFMSFSKDEKFLLAQYEEVDKGLYLRCYNVDSSEMIDVKFTELFPKQKFNLIFSSFDKDVLNIEVKERGQVKNEDKDKIGKWQINLKDFKIKKL